MKQTSMRNFFTVAGLGVLLISINAHAATITVNAPDGAVAVDGVCSISEAIQAANTDTAVNECPAGSGDDIIELNNDITLTTTTDTSFNNTGVTAISSIITIDGNDFTVQRDDSLDCDLLDNNSTNEEFRIFLNNTSGNLHLQQISIKNSCSNAFNQPLASSGGGGIYNRGTLSIDNVSFENNRAKNGGGILNAGTITTIQNSLFSLNSASAPSDGGNGASVYSLPNSLIQTIENTVFSANSNMATSFSGGSGIYLNGGTINTISNCEFNDNTGQYGAAILIESSFSTQATIETIQNNLFSNNVTEFGGSAVYITRENSTINNVINNTFTGNMILSSGNGGAIHNNNSTINNISNNTFSANQAAFGGAIFTDRGMIIQMNNNTFFENVASISGTAISNLFNQTVINMTNSLFINNIHASGGTPTDCGDTDINFAGSNNLSDNPNSSCPGMLPITLTTASVDALADNGGPTMTHALLAGSEALDISINGTVTDQRGFAAFGIRDIGAYELQGVELCSVDLQTDGFTTTVTDAAELNQAIECANFNGEINGGDTINLGNDITFTTEYTGNNISFGLGRTATPEVTTAVMLDGQGFVLERDSSLGCAFDGISDVTEFRLLAVLPDGNLVLNNTVIQGGCVDGTNGSFPTGGGILNAGELSITDSIVLANQANIDGGGVLNVSTISVIENVTFANNTSMLKGGGVSHLAGLISLISNSTFSGNSSAQRGGGLLVDFGEITAINNSTFSSNSSPSGGGIYVSSGPIINLQNNLFHNDSDCFNINQGSSNMADVTSTGCPGVLPTALTTASVGPLADNGCTTPLADGSCVMTHALLVGSEALDLSVNGTANDQRGFAAFGVRDIGAFEAQPPIVTAPADVTAVSTGPLTSPALGSATVIDADNPGLVATASQTADFPVGMTTVTWTATDSYGFIGTDSQVINILATVSGSVTGLAAGNSVTIQNNAGDDLTLNANGSFTFATALADGSTYTVTISQQPSNQGCVINNGSGTVSGSNVTDVEVNCSDNSISLSSDSLNYGNVDTGRGSTNTVTVTNNGSSAVTITSLTDPAAPFSITGGSCTNLPITLAAGMSCEIDVLFNPMDEGTFDGSLQIISNANSSPDVVALFGTSRILTVPTLSQWALLMLSLLMLGVAYKKRLD